MMLWEHHRGNFTRGFPEAAGFVNNFFPKKLQRATANRSSAQSGAAAK
jgi:hypothetical protein